MITHSSKASSRTADMHSSSPFHNAMSPHHHSDRGHSSSPSKDPILHHTTRQIIRQQQEGTSPSILISTSCIGSIADSLHRHVRDPHLLPSKIGPVSAAPTYLDIDADEQCNYKRSAQVTGTASHHLCRARSVTATPCSNTTAKKQVNRGQDWQQKPHLLL
jgi:hypothetical protein